MYVYLFILHIAMIVRFNTMGIEYVDIILLSFPTPC